MISQSLRDCSEDAGEVSSMYSTPNASKAFAILTLVSVSKNASVYLLKWIGWIDVGKTYWQTAGNDQYLIPGSEY